MPAVASPDVVKSPEAGIPSRAKSPVASRSKGTRRSWGFAMAARLAASLRQSLEGDPVARKSQMQSPTAASPADESKPAAEDAVLQSVSTTLAHHDPAAPVSASSMGQDETAQSAEDPFSPMFSPLSSGLDQMQTGSAFAEAESAGDSSWASHADDLQQLQKQAGLHALGESATPAAEPDAATASGSDTSLVTSKLMEVAPRPLLPNLFSKTSGASEAADGANTTPTADPAAPSTTSLDTSRLSQMVAVDSIAAAASMTSKRPQASLVDAATSTDEDAAMASTPMRPIATSRSGKKAQSVASPADAQDDGDPPESPSPLRDGLAFMTPLSAFDGTPEPGPGLSTEDAHMSSPAAQAVASEASVPVMQALDDSLEAVMTEDLGSSAAAVQHADAGLSNGPASARQAIAQAASPEGHPGQLESDAKIAATVGEAPGGQRAPQQGGMPAEAPASSGSSKPGPQPETNLSPATKQPLPTLPSQPQPDQMSLPAGRHAPGASNLHCFCLMYPCVQFVTVRATCAMFSCVAL